MGDLCGSFILFLAKIKPYLAMLSLQFGYAGMYIVTMICFKRGMSHWILVVYRHAVALVAIAPFALVLERKIRPKMTLRIFIKIVALGFLEPVIDQNFYYVGLKNTTATYASAFVNLLPAVTFIMAVIFRMERVNLKKVSSMAKVIGTVITLGGAMVMTMYKGPIVDLIPHSHGGSHHTEAAAAAAAPNWVMGTICLIACIVGWSGFFIVQSKTLEEYPAELSLAAWVCVMGVVEGGIVALIMERDMSSWVIGFDSRLLAAAYSGVVCSGIAYYVQSVVNKSRGPVFVTAFSPLSMVITAVLAGIILAENIYAGSLIGAFIIVIGLYSVVWGKSKDETNEKGKMQELPIVMMDRESVESKDTIKSKLQEKTPQEA
ncbi:PREDICTED: WAT1-related protein At4g08300-like [Ipomoea nil]|uniref:WAT1-related protein At4g08300-like n=1 Tax=Ipomoea nil TaxID=35883 RepID=UPI000901D3EA|nr:PREDICTED: WAT1-related protein At4g08300-like [Ipomoea nil]